MTFWALFWIALFFGPYLTTQMALDRRPIPAVVCFTAAVLALAFAGYAHTVSVERARAATTHAIETAGRV